MVNGRTGLPKNGKIGSFHFCVFKKILMQLIGSYFVLFIRYNCCIKILHAQHKGRKLNQFRSKTCIHIFVICDILSIFLFCIGAKKNGWKCWILFWLNNGRTFFLWMDVVIECGHEEWMKICMDMCYLLIGEHFQLLLCIYIMYICHNMDVYVVIIS